MKKLLYFLPAFFLLFSYCREACAQSDMEVLRKRIKTEWLQPRVDRARIEKWMNTISDNGSWPDINYKDVSRTGFQNREHLSRLVGLCRAFKRPQSPFKGDTKLDKAIDLSLNYWLAHDFISDNWWWNEIGVPDGLIQVLLIMDDDLTDSQISKTLSIVSRASYVFSWGARPSGDRIKIMGLQAKRMLFERDDEGFSQVISAIEGEIRFTIGRGMQYDYTFHHRDDGVNNTLAYGRQYADVFAYWAAVVSGTEYQFDQRPVHLLVNYYLDGICKMLVYGKYPDPAALNRDITRRGSLRPYSETTPEELLKATDYRRKELKEIVKIREAEAKPSLSFSRNYWKSDYFTFQRPDFFTSVRMYSTRNHNMEEPYNGEGLMNHYRGDGTNYISRTGKEYDELAPVYDWQKIPGTTIMQRSQMPPPEMIQQEGITEFVGSVSDGKYGAVGFDFKSPIDPLKAKKAWFFFDNEYVCLGAGITGDSLLNVVTTLNQCRLHGEVIVKNKAHKTVLKKGMHQLKGVQWIWHDSIGYVFPGLSEIYVANNPQTGSWYRVNHQESSPKKKVSKDVFKLWISHGTHPRGVTYQYIVLPAISKQKIEEAASNNYIQILSNTSDVQAVKNTRLNIFEGVFYKPGSIRLSDNLKLMMKDPGIVMIKMNDGAVSSVSVTDPSHHLKEIRMALSTKVEKKDRNFILTSHWNKAEKMSHLSIRLPQNVYRGKSVTVKF